MSLLWGIDLGGTKIEGAIIDSTIGPDAPICRVRKRTEREKGYEHILHQLRAVYDEMQTYVGSCPSHIGIGTPGVVDPESGQLKNSNTTSLNGRRLRDDLRSLLNTEITFANDANCFVIAESKWGVAAGANTIFGVILGTGVGGGIVIDGKIIEGRHGIAGEWGHNILEPGGEPCYCGQKGCVETILSGPALERYYRFLGGDGGRDFETIASLNCAAAARTRERLFKSFGKAIAQVINVLDPDIVVLGGGVGSTPGLAENSASEAAHYVFNPVVRTEFKRPKYGPSAGVFGAAALTPKN